MGYSFTDLGAEGCRRSLNALLHICWQVTGKEWHRVRNAAVSRWLTLGQHWCQWVLLSFHAFVRPSNHPWAWVCVLHTKRLEEMAYNLACWCIQMAYTQHSWMLMDIVVGLSVRPSVRLFVYDIFRWLCICWQITWNKWHKIWHDDVVIIGRWLLPSVVDTGDICCHYWQLILVIIGAVRFNSLHAEFLVKKHVFPMIPWYWNDASNLNLLIVEHKNQLISQSIPWLLMAWRCKEPGH